MGDGRTPASANGGTGPGDRDRDGFGQRRGVRHNPRSSPRTVAWTPIHNYCQYLEGLRLPRLPPVARPDHGGAGDRRALPRTCHPALRARAGPTAKVSPARVVRAALGRVGARWRGLHRSLRVRPTGADHVKCYWGGVIRSASCPGGAYSGHVAKHEPLISPLLQKDGFDTTHAVPAAQNAAGQSGWTKVVLTHTFVVLQVADPEHVIPGWRQVPPHAPPQGDPHGIPPLAQVGGAVVVELVVVLVVVAPHAALSLQSLGGQTRQQPSSGSQRCPEGHCASCVQPVSTHCPPPSFPQNAPPSVAVSQPQSSAAQLAP